MAWLLLVLIAWACVAVLQSGRFVASLRTHAPRWRYIVAALAVGVIGGLAYLAFVAYDDRATATVERVYATIEHRRMPHRNATQCLECVAEDAIAQFPTCDDAVTLGHDDAMCRGNWCASGRVFLCKTRGGYARRVLVSVDAVYRGTVPLSTTVPGHCMDHESDAECVVAVVETLRLRPGDTVDVARANIALRHPPTDYAWPVMCILVFTELVLYVATRVWYPTTPARVGDGAN